MPATPFTKPTEVERRWFVVDAEGQILGRLSTLIARKLQGKDKPTYTPNVDDGDFVIVVNADKVVLTGGKETKKVYRRHSGYLGSLKESPAADVRETHPERLIEHSVRGMLPGSRLGRKMLKKLKVYRGPDHPHQAQQPEPLAV